MSYQTQAKLIAIKSLIVCWAYSILLLDRNIYGRERELKQLKEYLSSSQTITLSGIAGVGKTALAAKLVDEVKDSFEYIYWRSLTAKSSLPQVLSAILQYFSLDAGDRDWETKVAWLLGFIQQHRCLLIFDNIDNIDIVRDNYAEAEYSFAAFLNYITANIHQSCIVLISRTRLNTVSLSKSQSLQIDGLSWSAVKKMLGNLGIIESDRILTELTQYYDSHPLSLETAATTIVDIFDGDIKEFISQKIAVFSEVEVLFDEQIDRLSKFELSVLYWLVINSELSLKELQEDVNILLDTRQIVECLRTLQDYLFITKIDGKFTLQPLIKKYAINRLVIQACREIERDQAEFLTTNALIKATAPEFIRQQQIELIIKPIVNKLLAVLGRDRLSTNFSNLLDRQRQDTPRKPGYLAGNIFNLLRHLAADIHRWNFSSLSVWQADGRGINLRHCNFAFADLTQSRFTEDFGETLSLAISPDKEQLAACDTNGQIRLWGLKDKRQQLTLRGHSAWTHTVAYSPISLGRLASCSSDRTVRLWDLNSGGCLGVLESHQGRVRAIAFTADGRTLVSGGDDRIIKLWDVDTQTVKLNLSGHTDNVRSVIISPDGQTLISTSDDGSIRFWSLDGKCLRTISAHQKPVWAIAINLDGSLIASGSVDNTVKLWDSNSGRLVTTFQHQGSVSHVAFSPDDRSLASASYDRTVRIWDIVTKQPLKILPHDDWVQSFVFAADEVITSSRNGQIKDWNLETEQIQTTVNSYSNGILAIAISPNGKQIASTDEEQTIQLWNVDRNRIERVLTGHSKNIWSIAYSWDNRFLASASDDRTVRIWNVATQKLSRTIQSDTWFWTVAFSPNDSSILASAGADCSIQFWNVVTGKLIQTFNGHTQIIRHITFDREGKYLASCGMDHTARVWQVDTGECISIFNHPSPVSSVAFSPKLVLATGSDDRIVRLWDIKTGCVLQSCDEHTGWVQSVAFSPDGKMIASGSHDGTIKLWQIGQKQAINTLEHGGWVRAIAFRVCPTTKQLQLVSGSGDGTIKLWDLNTAKCIKTLSPPQPYSQMNITGATGLTESEKATLKALGAIETNINAMDNVVYLRQFKNSNQAIF